MWDTDQPLFTGGWLREHLDTERARSRGAVDAVNPDLLLDRSDEENVAALLDALRVEPVVLRWEEYYSDGVHESKIDVQHDSLYGGSNMGRPVMVDATSVTVHVPFTGDADLLRKTPSTTRLCQSAGRHRRWRDPLDAHAAQPHGRADAQRVRRVQARH